MPNLIAAWFNQRSGTVYHGASSYTGPTLPVGSQLLKILSQCFPTTERAHGSFGQLLKLGFDTICLNWLFIVMKSFKVLSPSRAWQLNPPQLLFFCRVGYFICPLISTTIFFATWLEGIICTLPVPNFYCATRIDSRSTKLGVLRPFGLYRQKLRQQDGDLIRVLWRVYTWQPFLDQENVDFSTTTTPPVKASNFPCQDWMIQGSADGSSFPLFVQHGWASNVSNLKHQRHQRRYCFQLVSCRKDNNVVFLNYYKRFYVRNLVVGLPWQLWLAGICNCKLCRYSNHFFLE